MTWIERAIVLVVLLVISGVGYATYSHIAYNKPATQGNPTDVGYSTVYPLIVPLVNGGRVDCVVGDNYRGVSVDCDWESRRP